MNGASEPKLIEEAQVESRIANPRSANAMSAPRCGIAKAATATIRSAPHSAGDSHPGNKLKLEKATELISTHPKSAKMRSTSE